MNKDLIEISDGKRYGLKDMVRAACNDCAGCSFCCEDMGESIVLDPLDVFLLTKNLHCDFVALLSDRIELHVVEGMILPNLKMTETKNACSFLTEQGRCSIHSFRPGICRVFPLGRIYEENRLEYFLQAEGCIKENRSKVKVSKWLDTEELKKNQQFLIDWHHFRKKIGEILSGMEKEETKKTITMFLLNTFYQTPYDADREFYPQFYERLEKITKVLE